MKFQYKLVLFIVLLIVAIISILGVSFQRIIEDALEKEVGHRAVDMAETIALNQTIIDAFNSDNPAEAMNQTASAIFNTSGAEFITIADQDGIRYYHPNASRVGLPSVGGDNDPVLQEGRSIISKAEGSLGLSVRGKVPIRDNEEIIGFVSVGFLAEGIEATAQTYERTVLLIGLITLGIGLIGTVFITRSLKRATLGMEPKEIGRLYQEKQAIVESIGEGLVAFNQNGDITLLNGRAKSLLKLPAETDFLGRDLPNEDNTLVLHQLLEQVEPSEQKQATILMAKGLVVHKVPIWNSENEWLGTVISLRDTSDFIELTERLGQTKDYADALRAQTHEFSNKLYVLSGLLQLESYQEAIDYIEEESQVQTNRTQTLKYNHIDAWLQSLLIGKQHQAEEKGIDCLIELPDHEVTLRDDQRRPVITITGNLLDNAMESVLKPEAESKKIAISFTQTKESISVTVKDWGIGFGSIPFESLFETGYSTKNQTNHGYGMTIIQNMLDEVQGSIQLVKDLDAVTNIQVTIPSKR